MLYIFYHFITINPYFYKMTTGLLEKGTMRGREYSWGTVNIENKVNIQGHQINMAVVFEYLVKSDACVYN